MRELQNHIDLKGKQLTIASNYPVNMMHYSISIYHITIFENYRRYNRYI